MGLNKEKQILLREGDIIEETDDFYCGVLGCWIPVNPSIEFDTPPDYVGEVYNSKDYSPMRRAYTNKTVRE